MASVAQDYAGFHVNIEACTPTPSRSERKANILKKFEAINNAIASINSKPSPNGSRLPCHETLPTISAQTSLSGKAQKNLMKLSSRVSENVSEKSLDEVVGVSHDKTKGNQGTSSQDESLGKTENPPGRKQRARLLWWKKFLALVRKVGERSPRVNAQPDDISKAKSKKVLK